MHRLGRVLSSPTEKNLKLHPNQVDTPDTAVTQSNQRTTKKPAVVTPPPQTPEASSDSLAELSSELPKLAAAANALGGELHEEPADETEVTRLPGLSPRQQLPSKSPEGSSKATVLPPVQSTPAYMTEPDKDSTPNSDPRSKVLDTVARRSRATSGSNLKSLMFGLGMGGLVLLITTFSFFNERFIAPLITPSRVLSSTPLILDDSVAVSEESRLIIPKINVEVPLVFDAPSIQEETIQEALEQGIVHYPTTPMPGEIGNTVLFGHSSNNILNRGQFKFAFVLLNRLENGDTFFIEHEGVRYTYRIFESRIVPPTEISVLDPHPEKDAVASLITCDPPGTAINRLVVIGEQISPDPSGNTEVDPPTSVSAQQPNKLPSDAPSLWQRLFGN
jgi:LPXTG-site transpeptidase (sortase) family protein